MNIAQGHLRAAALLSVCLLLAVLVFPLEQNSAHSHTRRDELGDLIRRIEARYGAMQGLAADFEQSYRGRGGERERRERGRVFLQRPRKMRWEYEPKPGKLFIVNQREVWFYSPADREATRADAARISDERFPFLFLLGQKNLRREFREITFASGDAASSAGTKTLRLIPKRKDLGIRELYLEVGGEGQIHRIRQVDEAGAVSEFTLTNVRENYLAPAEAFEFRPPPGVTVRRQK